MSLQSVRCNPVAARPSEMRGCSCSWGHIERGGICTAQDTIEGGVSCDRSACQSSCAAFGHFDFPELGVAHLPPFAFPTLAFPSATSPSAL
jgi:hypothetical protein